jgi:hypothetical protein
VPPAQLSATTPQLVQRFPPLPQLPAIGAAMHVPFKQQPPAQLAGVHPEQV